MGEIKEPKINNLWERLNRITLKEYQDLSVAEWQEWLEAKEEVPEYFWNELMGLSSDSNMASVLGTIKEKLQEIYGGKSDKAKSFEDSRFTSLTEMLERGMVSCGSKAKIFATVLRKMGVPVKYVHVNPKEKKEGWTLAHSWLQIFDPLEKNWLDFDPAGHKFELWVEPESIKVYHDWEELKVDRKSKKSKNI